MTATETGGALYPQEALDAAACELGRQCHGGPADPDDIKLASDVLAVAAPIIQAAAPPVAACLDHSKVVDLIGRRTGLFGFPAEELAEAICESAGESATEAKLAEEPAQ